MATNVSAIQQFAAQVEANFAILKADLRNVQIGVSSLNQQIAALQQQISNGSSTLSAEDSAAIQQLVTDSAALDTQAGAITVPPVTPPAPPSA